MSTKYVLVEGKTLTGEVEGAGWGKERRMGGTPEGQVILGKGPKCEEAVSESSPSHCHSQASPWGLPVGRECC